jgi:hypothetical protein
MTAALNLGLLGNNVNTSGQVSLTAGVSGTLPVGNGGTGATTLTANNVLLGNGTSALQVVAPGASGNLLTSNGTTWTSAAAPVAVPSGVDGIGSLLLVANNTASNFYPGQTIAGSSVSWASNLTSITTLVYTEGTSSAFPNTFFRPAFNNLSLQAGVQRNNSGNTGAQNPGGHTSGSGTWRVLSIAVARSSAYDSGYNVTTTTTYYFLAQRIA